MPIRVIEPALVDPQTADQLARIINAAAASDAPHLSPVSGDLVRLRLAYGWEDRPTPHLFIATSPDSHPVGFAEVELPVWDNLHMAFVDLHVHPDARSGDVYDQLLEPVLSTVRSAGRSLVLGGAWAGSPTEDFWRRHGFSVASRGAQRRLMMADLNWSRLDELHRDSVTASSGYDIVSLPSPAPSEWMDGLVELHLAMNDSPRDEIEMEDDVWNPERLRAHERAMAHRGIRLHRLVARRQADGAFGGHTVLAIEEERPWLGFQEDTAVVSGHRGHKLGLRLKICMLKRLAELEPQITQVDTWNAESNTHMIAVNDALGCVVVGCAIDMQRRLEAADQPVAAAQLAQAQS
jgi:GNAT superfamily N-acetyltransferase